jgi:hypothetical protein
MTLFHSQEVVMLLEVAKILRIIAKNALKQEKYFGME